MDERALRIQRMRELIRRQSQGKDAAVVTEPLEIFTEEPVMPVVPLFSEELIAEAISNIEEESSPFRFISNVEEDSDSQPQVSRGMGSPRNRSGIIIIPEKVQVIFPNTLEPSKISKTAKTEAKPQVTATVKPAEAPVVQAAAVKKPVRKPISKPIARQIVYQLQLLQSNADFKQSDNVFKGLAPIHKSAPEKMGPYQIYKYTYGESASLNEILKLKQKIASLFGNVSIVAFDKQNGKYLSKYEVEKILNNLTNI
jgi:hypothetical protein